MRSLFGHCSVLILISGIGIAEAHVNQASKLSQSPAVNFAPAIAYLSGGEGSFSVAVADVNGDGKPDIVVANQITNLNDFAGIIGVLLGNGDGTFQPVITYDPKGQGTFSVVIADVNGDGRPDLVVANECPANCGQSDGSVAVLLGNGDGTFQAAMTFDSGGRDAQSIMVADVNHDGHPDIIVGNYVSNTVGILLGNGDGTFRPSTTYFSSGISSLAVGDVNGDGNVDILVANYPNSTVSVLVGEGDGTFDAAVQYQSGGDDTFSVAVADLNGDGIYDLATANECGDINCQTRGNVRVLLGNGDGTFRTATSFSSGGMVAYDPDWIAIGDINGDRKADLVASNAYDGSVGVLLGNGDGTFQGAVTFGTGGVFSGVIAIADLNADGKPDLVIANSCANSSGCVGVLINTSLPPTVTALTSSVNPSAFGQSVTFMATVTPQFGKIGIPTGTVNFLDASTNLGTSNLNGSGVAMFSTSTLAIGMHPITAVYNGDSNFAPSTSPVLNQAVEGAGALISPIFLNFANQTVGILSQPQVTTVTSTGNIALSITSIQLSGPNSGDFTQTNNCPASLATGASCSVYVTFKPQSTGSRMAIVMIADNAPDSPQTVSLSGVGVLPAITFSPTSLSFPIQVVFTTSPPQKVTLTNTGLGVLFHWRRINRKIWRDQQLQAGTCAGQSTKIAALGYGHICSTQTDQR